MNKPKEKALMPAALTKLEELSSFLDEELDVIAHMSKEEVNEELRAMGLDPGQPPPSRVCRLLAEEVRALQEPAGLGRPDGQALTEVIRGLWGGWPFQVYVSDEPLLNECTDEVKRLILEIRHLTRHRRYEEALSLAGEATRLAPDYWRARVSFATLSVVFGRVDEGERIFEQVSRDFPDNPKAVAAGLHGCGWIKEIRYAVEPLEEALREASSLYKEALRLDSSRANTRACLLNIMLTSDEADNDRLLLEESLLSEGFLEQMELELTARLRRREVPGVLGAFFEAGAFEGIVRRAKRALNLLQGAVGDLVGGEWFPSSLIPAERLGY